MEPVFLITAVCPVATGYHSSLSQLDLCTSPRMSLLQLWQQEASSKILLKAGWRRIRRKRGLVSGGYFAPSSYTEVQPQFVLL